ncbi:MAG: prephenate dehydrogenase [Clostridiales bacterium]|uniref:prephenate dehydrogenase n=1 Tax=Clostridium sp. N3C TaxID=1776758 RepID=UPI00092DF69E|nr:prephenate dehydrogenase [Clostridium sp. N3C]NLZ49970.1 prephenate dehydrogenase [Clostridiales bacterium]SCN22361.1 Arogenate dehydrogenase [Clostridium sp. N3C]
MDLGGFNITIVGLGLIGGSYAKALRKMNPKRLWAIDKDPLTIKKAEEAKVIDFSGLELKYILSESDLIIMALYPKDTIKFIEENMEYFKPGSIITDICGLKANVISKVNEILRNDVEFVGGHPMAGKELSGFDNADGSIFENANYFLTPTSRNKKETLAFIEKLIIALGCKKPILISAEDHDRIIAYTSHLPHILAVSLINCFTPEKHLKSLIGGSFKDATRVASLNRNLWLELIKTNKDNVVNILDCFINNLMELKYAILNGDDEKLLQEFNLASNRRKELE